MSPNTTGDLIPEGPASPDELTRLLRRHAAGDDEALREIIPLVYEDLRRIAHERLRGEHPAHTLSTTAVVHEAYLRLADVTQASYRDSSHFFAVCSSIIRNLLVDHARRRRAAKRGGGEIRIPLRTDLTPSAGGEPATVDLLELDATLTTLARHDPRLEQVVECRFFGGLTVDETAVSLGISRRTCERDWTRARAYLYRELRGR
jgi:RNA polymerase sigma factor (TIGR02999 family)